MTQSFRKLLLQEFLGTMQAKLLAAEEAIAAGGSLTDHFAVLQEYCHDYSQVQPKRLEKWGEQTTLPLATDLTR